MKVKSVILIVLVLFSYTYNTAYSAVEGNSEEANRFECSKATMFSLIKDVLRNNSVEISEENEFDGDIVTEKVAYPLLAGSGQEYILKYYTIKVIESGSLVEVTVTSYRNVVSSSDIGKYPQSKKNYGNIIEFSKRLFRGVEFRLRKR